MTSGPTPACRGVDIRYFFIESGGGIAVAKRICASCPVLTECLEHALSVPEKAGIWGGKTTKERRKILRRRARTQLSAAAPAEPDVA